MIEIKTVEDKEKIIAAAQKEGVMYDENTYLMAAADKNETISYTVYSLDGEKMVIKAVNAPDPSLFDGMVRSTMHVAANRSVMDIFYTENVDEHMLELLNFVKDKEKKQLNSDILFQDCKCGK